MTLCDPHRRHEPRRDRADRDAERHLRIPEFALRGGLHRLGQHVRGAIDRGRAGLRARHVGRTRRHDFTSAMASAPRPTRRCGSRSGPRRSWSRATGRKATATTASRAWCRKSRTRGDQSIYLVKLASGRQMRVTQPNTLRQGMGGRFRWDDKVWLSWDSSSPVVVTAVNRSLSPATRPAPFRLREASRWLRAHGPRRWGRAGTARSRLLGPHARLGRALPLAAALLPGPVPDRAQDLGVRDPARDAALRAALHLDCGSRRQPRINFENYAFLFKDSLYWKSFLNSIPTAGISTVFCLLIGYPMAYGIARSQPAWRNLLLLLVMLPFWTSFLLRVYAWIGILKNNGVINNVLMSLGIIDEPIVMLQTNFAMYIGIVYSYLPFMVLPLYTSAREARPVAARGGRRPRLPAGQGVLPDHACRSPRPASSPARMLVFIPAVGEFVIPALLGGPGRADDRHACCGTEFFNNRDWPVASAVAIAMLLCAGRSDHAATSARRVSRCGGHRVNGRRSRFRHDDDGRGIPVPVRCRSSR